MFRFRAVLLGLSIALQSGCASSGSLAGVRAREPAIGWQSPKPNGATHRVSLQHRSREPVLQRNANLPEAKRSSVRSSEALLRDDEDIEFTTLATKARMSRVVRQWHGKASYYADRFQGKLMASGIRYESDKPYAAHRTLPFGSLIRVVRLSTKAAVVLRVMDRGPYGDRRRIVDVSRGAAERLGMLNAGVTDVRVELLSGPR
jgi:rare lipoprotein A (peptidoglycan hydrolase)